jgi:hypothetical protein
LSFLESLLSYAVKTKFAAALTQSEDIQEKMMEVIPMKR